jgi:hypothetical protein
MLLTFISMVVATGLVLAVVVAERSRVTEELRRKARAGRVASAEADAIRLLDGLPNGVLFLERLAQLLQAAGRSGGKDRPWRCSTSSASGTSMTRTAGAWATRCSRRSLARLSG